MSDVEVNKHCVNKAIKFHILDESKMNSIGFRSVKRNNEDYWYYMNTIHMYDISFNVSFPNDESKQEELDIAILDEEFMQHYDYQSMLERDPNFKVALAIKDFVEKSMEKLQDAGVLYGHKYGDYI